MGLGEFVKGQFIDVIEHVETDNKLLVYKYSRDGNEIKQGAQLIVRQGQAGVFIYKGQIADIFKPGNYSLNTENLPVLSSLKAVPYLFNSPIKSDLYFINTTQFINNKWGTKNPIIKRDEELGVVRITAFGTYSFRVNDAELFINEVFGARKLNLTYDIVQYLTSMVAEAIAESIGTSTKSILDLATSYREMSNELTPLINEKANALGLEIVKANIENIGLPEEVEKLIDEQSGIGLAARNMDKFVQYQSARAIRDAAQQPGGLSGIGAGVAVGKVVSESIAETINPEGNAVKGVDDLASQLTKYKTLLDQGILTQAEFDDIKLKLLSNI